MRWSVSGEDNPEPNSQVDSRVVLRGAGSGDGGTEILMVKMRPGGTMFRHGAPPSASRTLATITHDARRETFDVQADSTANLRVGQRVVIRYQDPAYNAIYWPPLQLDPRWERVYKSGPPFHEVHTIAAIDGRRVRFAEPLHFTIRAHGVPFRLEIGLSGSDLLVSKAPLAEIRELEEQGRHEEAEALREQLRRDVAQATFGRLAAALGSMTPQDIERLRDLLADLNQLAAMADGGEDVTEEFSSFKERYGDLLPGDPETLDELLEELPEEQRLTFTLHHFSGLSLPEVSEIMGIPLATSKSRLRLAREKLRDKLERRGIEPFGGKG